MVDRKLIVIAFVLSLFLGAIYAVMTSTPFRVNYHQEQGSPGGSWWELNATYTVVNGQITEFDGKYVVSSIEHSADGSTRTVTRSGTCTMADFNAGDNADCLPLKRIMAVWDVWALEGKGQPEGAAGSYNWKITVG